MFKKLVLSCLVGALLFGSANLQAEEKGKVSQDALKAIGLGSAKVMSDKAGSRIRARFAAVWGRSSAGLGGGTNLGGGGGSASNNYFAFGRSVAFGGTGTTVSQSDGGFIGRFSYGQGHDVQAGGYAYAAGF